MRTWSMLLATIVGIALSGCTGASFGSPPTEASPGSALGPGERAGHGPKRGIYASDYYGATGGPGFVNGYAGADKGNKPASCTISTPGVQSIGTDPAGDLIASSSVSLYEYSVSVYRGPDLCGSLIGSVTLSQFPRAVASLNAQSGKIVVAEENEYLAAGNLVVCTLAKGCGAPLTRPDMKGGTDGAAIAPNGDCWISGEQLETYNPPGAAVLGYFKGCHGSGKTAKGYKNPYYGGLFIDNKGNIGAIDFNDGALYVYKGCNPVCTLIGGPFTLQGQSIGAGLNKAGDELAVGDFANQAIDVYAYSPTKLTYLYSVNNGLSYPRSAVISAVFSPSNDE